MKKTEQGQDNRIYTMAEEKPSKAVLKMGIPVTMGMLFMIVYNLVDTYFVGLLHDDYQLAAVNFAYPIMMVMIAIAGIVGNGGASYIARCIGAEKMEEANHTLTIGFELLLISGAFLTVVGLIFINPIVNLLGATDNSFQYTKDYVVVMFIGCIFMMGNYAIGQLLRSEGSAMQSMTGMIVGNVANMILDPIFIFALKLEIMGAAIATVLGNLIGMFICLSYYARKKTILMPSLKLLKFDGKIIKEIMLVGIPHTLEQFFSTAAIIVSNNLAVAYGDIAVAAIGVSNKIMSFGNYVYQGMAAGCQPLFGYNYGAKNYPRLKALIKMGIYETTAIELGIMILLGAFAPTLIGLFTENPEVLALGVMALRAAILMLPFVGATAIVRNTFNSIGKPLFAFGITFVRQLILYIPFMLIFDKAWGFKGLIHAQPAEELVCMIFAIILLSVKLNCDIMDKRANAKL